MDYKSLLIMLYVLFEPITSICIPTGPVLPPPEIPHNLPLDGLTESLVDLINNSAKYGWNSTTNSFSVMATSSNHTFFRYHHTAPLTNSSGVSEVADDTVYMAASVTKVFTVLLVWLEERMNLDDPVGKYVKELNIWDWQNVTLRMLTSQMAALPRWGYAFDQAPFSEDLEPLGFPKLSPSETPECGLGTSGEMCTRKEFFNSLLDSGFTGQVADRVSYSNLAYSVLGYALEDLTGKAFEDILRETITGPLGLDDTSTTPFDPRRAILPIDGAPFYAAPLEYFNPSAGLYSTPENLTKFLRAIYNNKLLSQAKTNEWLKPNGFTSQLDNLVGAPWEIFRPTGLTHRPRPVDHYTKSGDMPGFSSSYIVLVPEYDLGVTILGAGTDASTIVPLLLDTVQGTLIPTLEHLARTQAAQRYEGEYQTKVSNSSDKVFLVIDDKPGLKISAWTNRGVDMLRSFDILKLGSLPENANAADVRLYPLGVGERWRVQFSKPQAAEANGTALRGNACMQWLTADNLRYGKVPVDEVIFRVNSDGDVNGIVAPALRVTLEKV